MDQVFIEKLAVDTVIGAYPWERTIRQQVLLDIGMNFDCQPAGRTDALADALDYHAVARAVTALVEASECVLLEALAERVAGLLLRDFPIARLKLTVRKPGAVGNAAAVGISIERTGPL